MSHREVDPAGAGPAGPGADAARERDGRLGTARDLDVLPGERPGDAEAERLADGLLAGEAGGVVLSRVGPRLAVGALGLGEAALAEGRVALERAPDPCDLDQVDADVHCDSSRSIQSGRCARELTIPSGVSPKRSTASGRNFPVRTSTVRSPQALAPARSDSTSSPTIHVMPGSASSAASAASKYAADGLPITVASTSAAYSSPATNAPES